MKSPKSEKRCFLNEKHGSIRLQLLHLFICQTSTSIWFSCCFWTLLLLKILRLCLGSSRGSHFWHLKTCPYISAALLYSPSLPRSQSPSLFLVTVKELNQVNKCNLTAAGTGQNESFQCHFLIVGHGNGFLWAIWAVLSQGNTVCLPVIILSISAFCHCQLGFEDAFSVDFPVLPLI